MNLFYTTDINNQEIILHDQEAQHCAKVLRKTIGAEVHVADGKGHLYRTEIKEIKRNAVVLNRLSTEVKPSEAHLPHLAFGLIKNTTRLEWLLEKVTEIGVSRITPILCQRSEKRRIKKERLDKILVGAMKQSLHFYLPQLDEPIKMSDFLVDDLRSTRFIASFGEGVPELSKTYQGGIPSVILIGPEGDFTQEELAIAVANDFQRVNMGKSRLRAETAAMVACTILNQ